jgi:hypothetical protein
MGKGKKWSWHLRQVTDEGQTHVKVHSLGILIWSRITHIASRIRLRIAKYLTTMTGYGNAHGFLQLSDPADNYICAARSVAPIPNGAVVNETKKRKLFFFCGCVIVRPLMYEHSFHYYCCSPSSRNFFFFCYFCC